MYISEDYVILSLTQLIIIIIIIIIIINIGRYATCFGASRKNFHSIHSFSCHLHTGMCIVFNNFMVQAFNLTIGNIQQYIFYKLT
jgi:hypothetical protein